MALEWDLRAVQNRHENYPAEENGSLNRVTETMIFATMAVGIGDLSDENAPEFFARVHLWELAFGSFLKAYDGGDAIVDRPLTPEDVRGHIGLRTNVFYETPGKWNARFMKGRLAEFKSQYMLAFKNEQDD